ncbi:hypothetical protein PROFUN_15160 [Planoprotostelium fungivorum]|uniref:DEK-C domain-containing protein n=1 Tax=Planoprotostelium fungivorum TaxID=1890364 RepID=A0A2P6MXP5_9EUKA|nr:hypothetical protein PROFUN_15160 [Planoprotostelium fungivorum]
MANEDDMRDAMRKLLATNNMNGITPRELRRKLEDRLDLESMSLDSMKEDLSKMAHEVMEEIQKALDTKSGTKRKIEEDTEKPVKKNCRVPVQILPNYLMLGNELTRVSVKKFKGTKLIDVRKFYRDKGTNERKIKPTSKGISLSESQWSELVSSISKVDELRKMV